MPKTLFPESGFALKIIPDLRDKEPARKKIA